MPASQYWHARRSVLSVKRLSPEPDVSLETRGWIAYAPVKQVQRWVITPGDPSWSTTGFPRIVLPRVMSEFARARDRVELPLLLASFRVVGGQKATNSVLATGNANDDRLVDDERRSCHGKAIRRFAYLRLPNDIAGVGIKSDQITIETAEEQRRCPKRRVLYSFESSIRAAYRADSDCTAILRLRSQHPAQRHWLAVPL